MSVALAPKLRSGQSMCHYDAKVEHNTNMSEMLASAHSLVPNYWPAVDKVEHRPKFETICASRVQTQLRSVLRRADADTTNVWTWMHVTKEDAANWCRRDGWQISSWLVCCRHVDR